MTRRNLTLLVSILFAAAPAAVSAAPLGHLTSHSEVAVGPAGERIAMSDTTYAYPAGEEIATGGDGLAIVSLTGGSISLLSSSVGSVTTQDSGYLVALQAGACTLRMESAITATVTVAGFTVTSAAIDPAAPDAIDATIGVDPAGRVIVESRGRALIVTQVGSEQPEPLATVVAGQTWAAESNLADVASPSSGVAGKLRSLLPPAVAGVGATGTAVAGRLAGDDDDDHDTASPAR